MLTDTETPPAGTDTDGPALEAAAPAPAPAHNPIPTEAERPRYVVLDELHKAADSTAYRAGVWHFGTKPGRGDAPPTLTQHWICSPVHVQAVTFDSAGNNYGRLLRFCSTRGHWREWAMPMEMLKGDGDSVALSGSLTPRAWIDREGQPRPALDMVAHQVLTAYHVTRKRNAMQHHATQHGGDAVMEDGRPPGSVG